MQRRGKFYVFLRAMRHELFDEAFQAELAAVYQPRGTRPLPPAQLAMALLLQAYAQAGDAEAVENAAVDPRWQLALGCWGWRALRFRKGRWWRFGSASSRTTWIRRSSTRRWPSPRRGADSGGSTCARRWIRRRYWGAGRIEDTWNLLGRALATVVTCAAQTLRRPRAPVVEAVGLTLLDAPSLKAALDIDWQDPTAQADALARLLAEVDRLEAWVAAQATVAAAPAVAAALTTLR